MIEVGEKIAGKYRVDRIIGRGGMGYVVQAFHEQLAESVAIKFMASELAIAPDAPARFVREARAAFRIKSEHVARVLDVGEHQGAPFIVMELLAGHDLATEIAERFVPSEEAVGYVLQVCEALAAAHALGIVHRDLKPSNLFLTRKADSSPLIKVLDFGISKAMDDPNVAPADSLTMSHRLLGSPHYMSPEQARAPKSADARSDIWSLGIVLYELVLCERPFRGETPLAILASLMSDPLPELSAEQRRRMPDELMRVIRRCLTRDPDQRYPNVVEFARALLPMAAPNSAQIVARIDSIARVTPVTDSPPAESPPRLSHTHGSTLISARSSLFSTTRSTHAIDSQGRPPGRRGFILKAVALLAVVAVPAYWFVVHGVRAHEDVDTAASAQSDRLQKPEAPHQVDLGSALPAPAAASVDVNPIATVLEAAPIASAAPAASAIPTPSATPATSAVARLQPNTHAQVQPSRSAPPSAASKAPMSTGIVKKTHSGAPRPTSTADPKNQPE